MIVENQANIKIHFAGLEVQLFAEILHECSGVRYSLFSIFPLIANVLGIKAIKQTSVEKESAKYLSKASRHSIMDSGLYSLMFGVHAGKRTEKDIEVWYNEIINFVNENQVRSSIVEVDCQKMFGVEKAWEYRLKMEKDLPSNRRINVFHIEDGQKGLDRLIEFSDYLAISVPELRKIKKKDHVERLANYIKSKKPSIDIHLLGCTENNLLNKLNFCSSSDSTSWQQVNRFGVLNYNNGKKNLKIRNRDINKDILNQKYRKQVDSIMSKWFEPNEKRFDSYSKFALAGELLLNQYTRYAGDQS